MKDTLSKNNTEINSLKTMKDALEKELTDKENLKTTDEAETNHYLNTIEDQQTKIDNLTAQLMENEELTNHIYEQLHQKITDNNDSMEEGEIENEGQPPKKNLLIMDSNREQIHPFIEEYLEASDDDWTSLTDIYTIAHLQNLSNDQLTLNGEEYDNIVIMLGTNHVRKSEN